MVNNLMSKNIHIEKTQLYSTWGDKLLQHTDVLYDLQINKKVILSQL